MIPVQIEIWGPLYAHTPSFGKPLYTFCPHQGYYRIFHDQNGVPSSQDVYSGYSALRRSASIVEEPAQAPDAPPRARYIVVGYDAAVEILKRQDVFSGKTLVP